MKIRFTTIRRSLAIGALSMLGSPFVLGGSVDAAPKCFNAVASGFKVSVRVDDNGDVWGFKGWGCKGGGTKFSPAGMAPVGPLCNGVWNFSGPGGGPVDCSLPD